MNVSLTSSRKSLAAAALLLLLCGLAAAQGQQRQDDEVEFTAESVNVSFKPPRGCRALPEKTLAAAMPGQAVKYGCVTPGEGTSVFVMVSGSDGSRGALSQFERGFKDGVKQDDPKIRFTRRVASLNGVKWVNLRYTQDAAGVAMANDVYMIDWAGQIVVFDFLAPAPKFEATRAAFEGSAKSIGLSISVIAPVTAEEPAGVKKKN